MHAKAARPAQQLENALSVLSLVSELQALEAHSHRQQQALDEQETLGVLTITPSALPLPIELFPVPDSVDDALEAADRAEFYRRKWLAVTMAFDEAQERYAAFLAGLEATSSSAQWATSTSPSWPAAGPHGTAPGALTGLHGHAALGSDDTLLDTSLNGSLTGERGEGLGLAAARKRLKIMHGILEAERAAMRFDRGDKARLVEANRELQGEVEQLRAALRGRSTGWAGDGAGLAPSDSGLRERVKVAEAAVAKADEDARLAREEARSARQAEEAARVELAQVGAVSDALARTRAQLQDAEARTASLERQARRAREEAERAAESSRAEHDEEILLFQRELASAREREAHSVSALEARVAQLAAELSRSQAVRAASSVAEEERRQWRDEREGLERRIDELRGLLEAKEAERRALEQRREHTLALARVSDSRLAETERELEARVAQIRHLEEGREALLDTIDALEARVKERARG